MEMEIFGENKENSMVVLVVALVERWTRDPKVAGSTPGQGAIKSTRSTQPSIPLG